MPARRWRHCREASRLAEELAGRYGHVEPALVARAALLHDVGRSWRLSSLRAVSEWYGWEPDAEEWEGGEGLLHGPAGAAFASALGLSPEGAAAIRYHVTGRPDLSATDKLVMAADACEAGR
ncbi:MAG: HD domain-containing protein, partial [Candidatus Coatesbacteria bacterium]